MWRLSGYLLLLTGLWLPACNTVVEPEITFDYKVQPFYIIPTDKTYDEENARRVLWAVYDMQRWYQTATGGLTFELADEENPLFIYYARKPSAYYEDNAWDLFMEELGSTTLAVDKKGVISLIWVEGLSQVSPGATAIGGMRCEGECGAAIMPMHTIISATWPPVDMGLPLHEMGHALGLPHPVEKEDLPLPPEDNAILFSVMVQSDLRAGRTSYQHGFLTTEKARLAESPFMKPVTLAYQDMWRTHIINYPVTGPVPEPEIYFEKVDSRTVRFSTNIDNALRYYWVFGDGWVSHEPSPKHTFEINGLYNVTLMVTSPEHMAARTSRFVDVL